MLALPLLDAMTPAIESMARMVGAISQFVRESKAMQLAIVALAETITTMGVALVGLSAGRAAWGLIFGAGAIKGVRDLVAALQLVPLALRGIINTAGVALAAVAAIWNADDIAKAINSIKVFGVTVEQHITRAFLEAEKAWVQLQMAVGAMGLLSDDKLVELFGRMQEIQQAIDTLGEEFADDPVVLSEGTGAAISQTAEEMEKIAKLEAERVRYQIASLELGIKQATTDERRTTLLQAQLHFANDLVASAEQRLAKAQMAEVGLEDYLGLEKELLQAENERFEISQRILAIQEKTRDAAKQAAVDAAAARAEAMAQAREVIGSTFAGQAAKGYRDFQEQRQAEQGAGVGGVSAGAIAGLQNAMVQLGTAAQQVGQAISSVIGGAVHGIAGAIEGLIRRTMTWKDALLSVGQAILDSIIGAISQMLAQMLVGFLMQQLFGRLMSTQAKQLAGAWAPAAFFAAVATSGSAVGIGVASMSAGLASMQALAQFAEGGFTGPGPKDKPVGIVHAGEYVIPARTVNEMGIHHFDALVAGQGQDAGPTPTKSLNQNIHMFFDRRAWMKATRDDIEAIAVDVMRRNAWKVQLG